MSERRFIVTKEEDGFLLGHFEDEGYPGMYLTAEYLGRLRQIRNAVTVQLNLIGTAGLPDALTDLLAVINHLTKTHVEQMRGESATFAATDPEHLEDLQDLEGIEEVRRELEQAAGGDPIELNAIEQARRDLEQAVKDLEKSSEIPRLSEN